MNTFEHISCTQLLENGMGSSMMLMMLEIFQRRLCLGMHNLRAIFLSSIHPTDDIFIGIWVFGFTVLFFLKMKCKSINFSNLCLIYLPYTLKKRCYLDYKFISLAKYLYFRWILSGRFCVLLSGVFRSVKQSHAHTKRASKLKK